ncbi:hypothetical protein D3C87_2047650 [compost metagenome]
MPSGWLKVVELRRCAALMCQLASATSNNLFAEDRMYHSLVCGFLASAEGLKLAFSLGFKALIWFRSILKTSGPVKLCVSAL